MIATFLKLKFLFGILTPKKIQRHENSLHGGVHTAIAK
jgi:hypothetical protein